MKTIDGKTGMLVPSRPPRWRLVIPILLIVVLALPVALLLFPFFIIGCLIAGMRPFRTAGVLWQVFWGLRGTEIEVTEGNLDIRIAFP